MSRTRLGSISKLTATTPPPETPSIVFTLLNADQLIFDGAVVTDPASDFTVNWGDGPPETFNSGDTPSHAYSPAYSGTVTCTPLAPAAFATFALSFNATVTAVAIAPGSIVTTDPLTLGFVNCSLNQSSINTLIVYLATLTDLASGSAVGLQGGTNAVPGPSVVADLLAIIAAGVALTYNAHSLTLHAVSFGGIGYQVNDNYRFLGGTPFGAENQANGRVTAEIATVATGLQTLFGGYYAAPPSSPAATEAISGIGSGLTVDFTDTIVAVPYNP